MLKYSCLFLSCMSKTLISTVYEGTAVKIAITKLSPDKVVLIGAKTDDKKRLETVKKSIAEITKMYNFLEFEVLDTSLYDIYSIVKDIAEVIDKEHKKGNEIIAHISESRKTQAIGLLFACFLKKDFINGAYYLQEEGNIIQPLPLIDFKVNETKQNILLLIKKKITDVQEIMDKTGKSRAMIYAHIQELKKDGYLTENLELTDAGKILVM